MKELLKDLCCLNGTSGREDAVREYIISRLGGADYTVDALGNLIVRVKGRKPAKNTVMLCAHMDEVGLMATFIRPDGLIKFVTVGGIVATALAGKAVRFENGTPGVIGLKPVHLCSADEKLTQPDKKELCVDIGAKDRDEAAKLIAPGDTAVFVSEYVEMGKGELTINKEAIIYRGAEEGKETELIYPLTEVTTIVTKNSEGVDLIIGGKPYRFLFDQHKWSYKYELIVERIFRAKHNLI